VLVLVVVLVLGFVTCRCLGSQPQLIKEALHGHANSFVVLNAEEGQVAVRGEQGTGGRLGKVSYISCGASEDLLAKTKEQRPSTSVRLLQ
jgi:hypothetical protein